MLTGPTGNLKDSIDYKAEPRRTIVYANPQNKGAKANYAVPHNFGATNAGRNRNVVIPKRQFIGKSAVLESKIYDKIQRWLSGKLKQLNK
jgi:phage gpG-like protein